MRTIRWPLLAAVAVSTAVATLNARGEMFASPQAATPERVDLLTFAQGAVPVRIAGSTAKLGVGMDKALAAIDGSTASFSLAQKFVTRDADTEFIYRLPRRSIGWRFPM